MKKLKDQVAIVIGATSGIGEACARAFAAEGATAIITGRREEKIESIVKDIKDSGGKADGFTLDVTDLKAGQAVIDSVIQKYGRLDVIHLNSGMVGYMALEDVDEELWDEVHETNLKGHFFLTQRAMPALEETKGRVLFTSSLAGMKPSCSKTNYSYGISKASIDNFVRVLALDFGEKGIRVNAIAPGVILTEITGGDSPEVAESLASMGYLDTIPMKRFGHVSEIASLAVFLVSDDSSFITGQVIACCGGQSIA